MDDYQYYLTFVNDYSRSTFVYLLQNQNDTVDVIISLIILVKNQYDTPVKVFRLDNAKKYCIS